MVAVFRPVSRIPLFAVELAPPAPESGFARTVYARFCCCLGALGARRFARSVLLFA